MPNEEYNDKLRNLCVSKATAERKCKSLELQRFILERELEIIENFSQSLANKLTHEITKLIRSAIAENNLDLLAELKHLYKLKSKSTESPKNKEKNDEPL